MQPGSRARVQGPVAQLGERLVCIQEVVGSIPVGSTSLPEVPRAYSSVWLERTPDKREVGGSNPPRPTIPAGMSVKRWVVGMSRGTCIQLKG